MTLGGGIEPNSGGEPNYAAAAKASSFTCRFPVPRTMSVPASCVKMPRANGQAILCWHRTGTLSDHHRDPLRVHNLSPFHRCEE